MTFSTHASRIHRIVNPPRVGFEIFSPSQRPLQRIERVLANTVGLHGDVAGIIGGALPEIAAIELKTLAADAAGLD